jgi:TonB family protein
MGEIRNVTMPFIDVTAGVLLALFLSVQPQPAKDCDCVCIDPKVLEAVPSIYPDVALLAEVEGEVIIKVIVDKDGKVTEIEVIKGVPSLYIPAEKAARQWKFTAAKESDAKADKKRTALLTFVFRLMPDFTPSKEIGDLFVPPYTMEMRRWRPEPL